MPFVLPKFAEQYVARVVDRAGWLIQFQIWADLPQHALRTWLANFRTPEEQYLGACLLDSLIYRSEPQTLALAEQILQRVVPDLLRREPPRQKLPTDWLERLRDTTGEPGVRIVPVVRTGDAPTKSSFVVLRALKRHLGIAEKWIVTADKLAAIAPPLVLVVDDFLGTGQQICDFLDDCSLVGSLPDSKIVYAPLAAHEMGLATLAGAQSSVTVAPADSLTATSNLFGATSCAVNDGLNSVKDSYQFYCDFLRSRGIFLRDDQILGYGDLGLGYAFKDSVPDNNLPIFWWAETAGFAPLFER